MYLGFWCGYGSVVEVVGKHEAIILQKDFEHGRRYRHPFRSRVDFVESCCRKKASTSSIRGLQSLSFSEATLDRSAFLRSQSAISCSTETFSTISSRDFSVTPMSSRSRRLKPGPNAVVILYAPIFPPGSFARNLSIVRGIMYRPSIF